MRGEKEGATMKAYTFFLFAIMFGIVAILVTQKPPTKTVTAQVESASTRPPVKSEFDWYADGSSNGIALAFGRVIYAISSRALNCTNVTSEALWDIMHGSLDPKITP